MALSPEPAPELQDSLAAFGLLHEPVRRALYLYVVGQPGDVGRDEAATAFGIQRNLAAFHLDKLVEAGLLDTTFRRLSGRSGPGAGRPAKLYRRSAAERTVSIPPRRYDLAATLLAEAVEEAGDRPARSSLADVARRFGRRLGEEIRARSSARASRARRMAALAEGLGGYGYDPRWDGTTLRLDNCPFHILSGSHRELVCGMNLCLLEGVVEGMRTTDLQACPRAPEADECCVTIGVKGER
jgi:predicted ArsR family transcriptional regulator